MGVNVQFDGVQRLMDAFPCVLLLDGNDEDRESLARLLAETLRTHFAALSVTGLPPYVRCTASFGVAERHDGEGLSGLRRRADAALYTAKRDGRDRVAVAGDPHADVMPAHPVAGTSLAKSA